MADRYWVGGTASWDGTAGTKWALTSGGAGGQAIPTSADDVFFNAASGTNTVTLSPGNTGARSINYTGFTGTIAGTGDIIVSGSITLVAGMTYTHTGFTTFNATATITSAGKTLGPITVSATGGTVTLADALTLGSTRLFTLSSGTFRLNGFTLTTGLFNSNIGSVRELAFGSGGQIFITGDSAIVLNVGTIANMTITSGAVPGTFSLTANALSGTRTVRTGLWTTAGSAFRFNVTAGSDTVQTDTAFNVDDFNLTGFTGTFTRGISDNYYGNYILNSSVTLTSTAAQQATFVSFSGRTNTIQTFGKTLDFPIAFNGNDVVWQLQDALTQGSTRTFTFSNGTIQFKNGTTNTVGSFVTSGSALKYLASTTAGSQATISQASGPVAVTYLSVKDSIATGAAFNAIDPTNLDNGNNTGWTFPRGSTLTVGPGWSIGSGWSVSVAPPGADLFTISFVDSAIFSVNSSAGTSSAVTLPATIQANDIIVVYCTTGSSTSATPPTQDTPSGYTLIDSATAGNVGAADAERAHLYYKVAVLGDAGSTLTITSSTSDFRAICVGVFRTTKGYAPIITNASINSAGGTANLPNQTVTSSLGAVPLIVFAAYVNTTTRTFTPTQDGEIVTANTRVLRYKIYNSSPANTTVGSTISAQVICMQSFYMAVS